jgi:hypothetical protein
MPNFKIGLSGTKPNLRYINEKVKPAKAAKVGAEVAEVMKSGVNVGWIRFQRAFLQSSIYDYEYI